jgi:NitT/TauT family transport system substrate-binding protein
MKIHKYLVITIAFLAMLTGCANQDKVPTILDEEPTHIRLPMGYIPSVQYAPLYSADTSGFFKDVGLELEFDYSYETDGVALVASDELQFSLASGEQVLLARAKGLPVVYVMAWYRDYPIAVVSKAEKEILKPSDLKGKIIGIPGLFGASYVGFRALLDSANLQESDVTLESIGFNQVEAVAADQVDAAVVYVNNEPYQLQKLGFDVNVISVSDFSYLISNGLITNEQTIAENPDLVRNMVQAFIRGIKYTVTYPSESYENSEIYVEGLPALAEHLQTEEIERYVSLYQTEPYGYSELSAWENMQTVLLKMGLIGERLDLKSAFTNDFIE